MGSPGFPLHASREAGQRVCLHPEAAGHGRIHSERAIDHRLGTLTGGGAPGVKESLPILAVRVQVTSVTAYEVAGALL